MIILFLTWSTTHAILINSNKSHSKFSVTIENTLVSEYCGTAKHLRDEVEYVNHLLYKKVPNYSFSTIAHKKVSA